MKKIPTIKISIPEFETHNIDNIEGWSFDRHFSFRTPQKSSYWWNSPDSVILDDIGSKRPKATVEVVGWPGNKMWVVKYHGRLIQTEEQFTSKEKAMRYARKLMKEYKEEVRTGEIKYP